MAATVDAHVTVKQHGFHVKQTLQAAFAEAAAGGSGSAELLAEPGAPALPPPRREESARGLLNFSSPCVAAAPAEGAFAALPPGSGCLQPAEHAHLTPGVKRLMKSVVRGLKAFQEPEAATEGLGGTYFFTNETGQKIAIMKPCDEEPLAPNNPKGFVGRQLGEPGLKPTVRVGEAASREVAAYLLDHDRFAGVPHTVMVKMTHPIFHVQQQNSSSSSSEGSAAGDAAAGGDTGMPPCKLGSLQQFVPHDCDTSEMGASRFSGRDVQRIGILDIRLFNTDRHAGNMLVRRPRSSPSLQRMDGAALLELQSAYELIPIDHGFALPEALEPPYFEWQHWPQAMMPFGREELDYIASLDAKADINMLRQEVPSLRLESLRVLEVSTTLLKECAAAGLTLAEIAGVVTRPLIGMEEEPSELERICFNARAEVEDISDSELEEVEELGEAGCGSEVDEGVIAMLSMEEEVECADVEVVSPTSSAGASDHTAFKMSLAGSEASRLEDALFSMDEDASGNRTPPRALSPDNLAPVRLPPSRFAAEAGKGAGAPIATVSISAASQQLPPVTPKVVGPAVTFVSPGGDDSLPASFDSMTLHEKAGGTGAATSEAMSISMAGSSLAASSTAFAPCSFAPSACGAHGSGGNQNRPTRKTRSRRKLAIGSRLLKLTTQTYPPLVESRSGGAPSMSALAVFRDLTEEQWEGFMHCVRCQVHRKLRDGAWKLATAPKGAPMMSCPRF